MVPSSLLTLYDLPLECPCNSIVSLSLTLTVSLRCLGKDSVPRGISFGNRRIFQYYEKGYVYTVPSCYLLSTIIAFGSGVVVNLLESGCQVGSQTTSLFFDFRSLVNTSLNESPVLPRFFKIS